jgi:hypothetical protein
MAKGGQSLKFSPGCKTSLPAINPSCTKLLSIISDHRRVCVRYTMRCYRTEKIMSSTKEILLRNFTLTAVFDTISLSSWSKLINTQWHHSSRPKLIVVERTQSSVVHSKCSHHHRSIPYLGTSCGSTALPGHKDTQPIWQIGDTLLLDLLICQQHCT